MDEDTIQYPPDSKEARAQRLRQLRNIAGHPSRKALERQYGLSASTLRHYEDAIGTGLTEHGAKVIADIYQKLHIDCSITWLLYGRGKQPKIRSQTIPLVGPSTEQTDHLATIDQEIKHFRKLHPESIILECRDDAMQPFYRYGDYVGGIRQYANTLHNLAGRDCIIETKEKQTLLRRLQSTRIQDRFNLIALNPDTHVEQATLYSVEILTAAPVIRIWRGKKW